MTTQDTQIPAELVEIGRSIARNAWLTTFEKTALAREIAGALYADRQRDQWQPIATAPKDGTSVDLWGINHLHFAKEGRRASDVSWGRVRDWMGNEREDWEHGRGEDFEPTHWMRLPAPPKGGE